MYAQTRLLQAAEELHFATFFLDWCQTFMITDSWKSPVKAWSLPGSGLMIQNYRLRRVHIVTVSKQSKHPQNTHFIERTSYNACPQPGSFIMRFIHKKCEIFSLWTIWEKRMDWMRTLTLCFVVVDECEYTTHNLLNLLAKKSQKMSEYDAWLEFRFSRHKTNSFHWNMQNRNHQ